MTNVTSISTHRTLPLASAATITLQRALADGTNPAVLRAVASWNDRKSYDERRRKARVRHKSQALVLREVADELEWGVSVGRAA